MSQVSRSLRSVRRQFAIPQRAASRQHPTQLNLLNGPVLLSLIGVLVSLLVDHGVTSFLEVRLRELLVVDATAQANDEVQLGILPRVTPSDFDAPYTPARIEDLRTRLAPVMSHVRSNGSNIVGIRLVTRDGTIIYADAATRAGSSLTPTERPLLASALMGQRGSEPSWLPELPLDPSLAALYGEVLVVSVPVASEGGIFGAYIVELNPAAATTVRWVVWVVVACGLGLTACLLSVALFATRTRSRAHAAADVAALEFVAQQPVALEQAAAPQRAVMCAVVPEHRLTVCEETIRSHVKSILNKLGQPNRTQAVLEALKIGLLEVA